MATRTSGACRAMVEDRLITTSAEAASDPERRCDHSPRFVRFNATRSGLRRGYAHPSSRRVRGFCPTPRFVLSMLTIPWSASMTPGQRPDSTSVQRQWRLLLARHFVRRRTLWFSGKGKRVGGCVFGWRNNVLFAPAAEAQINRQIVWRAVCSLRRCAHCTFSP